MNKKKVILIGILILIMISFGLFFVLDYLKPVDVCPGKGCVKVQTTCCPCSMGGEEICVKEEEADEYLKKLNSCKEGLICPAVYNCKIDSCENP